MQCPFCKQEILDGAIKCKYCHNMPNETQKKLSVPDSPVRKRSAGNKINPAVIYLLGGLAVLVVLLIIMISNLRKEPEGSTFRRTYRPTQAESHQHADNTENKRIRGQLGAAEANKQKKAAELPKIKEQEHQFTHAQPMPMDIELVEIVMVSIRGRNYSIGKYEVTQGQWKAVMGNNPSEFQKGDNYPVEQVSWNDCQEFIRKLNEKTGRHYRLPSEAEWEYACRAGTTTDRYGDLNEIAWYDRNSGDTTHLVGQKQANAFGIYDMLGNVWEWCQNASGSDRVGRGGGWGDAAGGVSASVRGGSGPGSRGNDLGFRLAAGSAGN